MMDPNYIPVATQEQRVDWERNEAIRDALAMIRENFPDVALSRMLSSVHRQAGWMPPEDYTARGTITWPRPEPDLQAAS